MFVLSVVSVLDWQSKIHFTSMERKQVFNCVQVVRHKSISPSLSLLQAHLFDGCPKGFMRMLCMCIKPKLYLPHQIVVARGDVDHEMYFIHSGEVDVLSEDDDDTPIATLKKGKIFGEASSIHK